MVKVKGGFRRPVDDELLQRIKKIRVADGDEQDRSELLVATFQECLRRCSDSSCKRQDIDDLGTWISTAKGTLPGSASVLSEMLDRDTQSQLNQLFWEKLDLDKSAIAKRTEGILPMALALLDAVSVQHAQTSQAEGSSKVNPGNNPSHLASLLLNRASQDIETRTSLVIYDMLLSIYPAEWVLASRPCLYSDLVDRVSPQVDMPTRRSRVCVKLLKSYGSEMGLDFESSSEEPSLPPRPEAWRKWAQTATDPIVAALLSFDRYKRSSASIYSLTELLELAPASLLPLLAKLLHFEDSERSTPAVLAVLRAARGQGLCRIDPEATQDELMLGSAIGRANTSLVCRPSHRPHIVIPPSLLIVCGQSSVEELQVSALSLVIDAKGILTPFSPTELDIMSVFLEASFSSTHPSGRGSIHSLVGRMLARMTAVGYAAEREIAKGEVGASEEELKKMQQCRTDLDLMRAFIQRSFQLVLDCLHPGSPYHVVIAALTFLELILTAGVDPTFERSLTSSDTSGPTAKTTFGKFDRTFSLGVSLIDARLVRTLLACADSTYEDIQSRALGLLHYFPAPLHGLEKQTEADKVILLKAKTLLLSGRDSESTAAASLLKVYQRVYIQRVELKHTPLTNIGDSTATDFGTLPSSKDLVVFADLLTFLEVQVSVAESEGLYDAAKTSPLHGALITLQKMLQDDALWRAMKSTELQRQSRPLFQFAQSLIDRVWKITQPILCAAAPEGGVGEGMEPDDAAVDTEIARALTAAEGQGGDGEVDAEALIRKSQVMLSYSWRGMKEAAALLGRLVSMSLSQGSEVARGLWTSEEIEQVGQRFDLWMTAVRHRGAFSTIYPAYSIAAGAILRSEWTSIKDKPKVWLSDFITKATSPHSSISTTRRSAGIGYAVLALVTALPLRQDRDTFSAAISQLQKSADDCLGQEEDERIIAAHIHSMNILRVLALDSTLSEAMQPYVDGLLSLAIRRFRSSIWYIRNAGLMLFSALIPKAFPSRKANEDDVSSQLPANRFFQMYPSLFDALKTHLESAIDTGLHQATNRSDAEQAGSLYAVLFLLSRMQAVEHQETATADLVQLRDLVSICLDSIDFKIREMAARAFSSLTTPSEASAIMTLLLRRCETAEADAGVSLENRRHASLLVIARLARVHPQGHADAAIIGQLKDLQKSLVGHSNAVVLACEECIAAFASRRNRAEEVANLNGSSPDNQTSALREKLWDITADFQVRAQAAEGLYDIWSFESYKQAILVDNVSLRQEWERLAMLTVNSDCVPLREAALALLGRVTAAVFQTAGQDKVWEKRAVSLFSRLVKMCASEDQHVQSRLAAAQSLLGFGEIQGGRGNSLLFPPAEEKAWEREGASSALFALRIATINLLQDDDEEVRLMAGQLIASTISNDSANAQGGQSGGDEELRRLIAAAGQTVASSRVSTVRAWAWMASFYNRSEPASNPWTKHLLTLILPWLSFEKRKTKAGTTSIISADLKAIIDPPKVLFAVERPNLYIDVEDEVLRAWRALKDQDQNQDRVVDVSSIVNNINNNNNVEEISRQVEIALSTLVSSPPTATASIPGRLLAVRLTLGAHLLRVAEREREAMRQRLDLDLDLDLRT